MHYCVRLNADPRPTPARKIPNPKPRTAAGRYCVQWKSLYALLRTMETAYNGNPYMRYCVQWKITSPNADPEPPPAGKIPNPNSDLLTDCWLLTVVVLVVGTREGRLRRQWKKIRKDCPKIVTSRFGGGLVQMQRCYFFLGCISIVYPQTGRYAIGSFFESLLRHCCVFAASLHYLCYVFATSLLEYR